MKLYELRPAEGAVSSKKRLGRGTATGQGKTSGHGQKRSKVSFRWWSKSWIQRWTNATC